MVVGVVGVFGAFMAVLGCLLRIATMMKTIAD
jgi:hypothetical protein